MKNEKFYQLKGKKFTPILPDGFIGRPWDNLYTIKNISSEKELLFLFSDDICLKVCL